MSLLSQTTVFSLSFLRAPLWPQDTIQDSKAVLKVVLNSKLRLVGDTLFHAINCKANKSGLSIQMNFYKFDKIRLILFIFWLHSMSPRYW